MKRTMKREEGYYWVKRNDDWIIAEYKILTRFPWEIYHWEFIWNEYILMGNDSEFEEINERRITSPDEWPTKDNERKGLKIHIEHLDKPSIIDRLTGDETNF